MKKNYASLKNGSEIMRYAVYENLTASEKLKIIEKFAEHEVEINGLRAKRTTSDLLREYYEGKEQAYKEILNAIRNEDE